MRAGALTIGDFHGDVVDGVAVLGHEVSRVLVVRRSTRNLAILIDGDSLGCADELIRGVGQRRTISCLGRDLNRSDGIIGPCFLALELVDDQILRRRLLIAGRNVNNDGIGVLSAVDSRGNRQLKNLGWRTRLLLRNGDVCNTILIEGHLCALRGVGGICRERGSLRQGIHGLTVEGQLRRNLSGGVLAVHGKVLQCWVVNAVGLISLRVGWGLRPRCVRSLNLYGCRLGRLLTILRCSSRDLIVFLELFALRNACSEGTRFVRVLGCGDFLTGREGYFHLTACRSRDSDLGVISLHWFDGRGRGCFSRGILGGLERTALGALAIRGLRNEGVIRTVLQFKLAGSKFTLLNRGDVIKRCDVNGVCSVESRLTVLVFTQLVGRNSNNLHRRRIRIGDIKQRNILALGVLILFASNRAGQRLRLWENLLSFRLWSSREERLRV